MLDELDSLETLADKYDVFLSDVWGVLHNGVSAYQQAHEIFIKLRQMGKIVILITNSPRRKHGVVSQLEMLGLTSDAYDDVITSGELTRSLIQQSPKEVFFLGPDRDLQLLDGLDVTRVDKDKAQTIVCTGFFDDETEKPEDYQNLLAQLQAKDVPFVCANPDLIVERGDRLIPCAGSIALLYAQMGGKVFVAGKPHRPVYDAALDVAGKLKNQIDLDRVVALGDGVPTDVKGAIDYGLDLIFVARGIHIKHYETDGVIDPMLLSGFLSKEGVRPNYWIEKVK